MLQRMSEFPYVSQARHATMQTAFRVEDSQADQEGWLQTQSSGQLFGWTNLVCSSHMQTKNFMRSDSSPDALQAGLGISQQNLLIAMQDMGSGVDRGGKRGGGGACSRARVVGKTIVALMLVLTMLESISAWPYMNDESLLQLQCFSWHACE